MAIFAGGPLLEGNKIVSPTFWPKSFTHQTQHFEFVPILSEIGDLSCITSCLVLPGLLVDTLLRIFNF